MVLTSIKENITAHRHDEKALKRRLCRLSKGRRESIEIVAMKGLRARC